MMKTVITYILLLLMFACAETQVLRYPPNRWLKNNDTKPITVPKLKIETIYEDQDEKTMSMELQRVTDLSNTIVDYSGFFMVSEHQEALNTNNFDEVADSTWFTNNILRFDFNPKKLATVPTFEEDINSTKPWTIISVEKSLNIYSFLIKDQNGKLFFAKFDTINAPELITSASIISTRIMNAIGYNVPLNNLIKIDPNILLITNKTYSVGKYGTINKFLKSDFEKILKQIKIDKDGLARAVIGEYVDGTHFGSFAFSDKRRSDKNDLIPHEHMRELRGLLVLASYLDFLDIDSTNTLDVFIKTNGNLGYFKHYITNFETTLGAGRVETKDNPEHLKSNYNFDFFDPVTWKPNMSNPAFLYMTDRDAFWMAKIIVKLSDNLIKEIVNEAKITNKNLKNKIVKGLITRRNKIGEYWFSKINPLDNFNLKNNNGFTEITFDDLLFTHNLITDKDTRYRFRLKNIKNIKSLYPWKETQDRKILINKEMKNIMVANRIYSVQIQTKRSYDKWWPPSIDLLVKKDQNNEIQLLGLYRRYGNH